MTLQEVRELLKAGFSRDEIMSFSTESTGNAQEEKQTSVQNENQPAPATASIKNRIRSRMSSRPMKTNQILLQNCGHCFRK